MLVWRQNALVNYRNLEPVERDALVIVAKGASFAAVCEAVAAGAEEPNRVALIGRLMARWLADGNIMAADAMLVTRVRDGFPSGGILRMIGHFGETSTALSASKW